MELLVRSLPTSSQPWARQRRAKAKVRKIDLKASQVRPRLNPSAQPVSEDVPTHGAVSMAEGRVPTLTWLCLVVNIQSVARIEGVANFCRWTPFHVYECGAINSASRSESIAFMRFVMAILNCILRPAHHKRAA
eukprot:1216057-Amphidinium_carterae.1